MRRDAEKRHLPSVEALEDAMKAGLSALDRGDADAALKGFDRAISAKPSYEGGWVGKAQSLRMKGLYDEAIQCLNEALRIRGDDPSIWASLSAICHKMSDHRGEADALAEALRLNPVNPHLWVSRGLALHDLEKYEDAMACYDKALQLLPEYAAALNNKAVALMRLNREDEAIEVLEEAVTYDPHMLDAHTNKVLLLQRLKRHGLAIQACQAALSVQETPELWYLKGLSHRELGEVTAARNCFSRALGLRPGYPEVIGALASLTSKMGDVDRGEYECFGEFEEGDPGCLECEVIGKCKEAIGWKSRG